MIDMIGATRVFDFGYILGNWHSCEDCVGKCVESKSTDIVSYYERNIKNKWENQIALIQEAFEEATK